MSEATGIEKMVCDDIASRQAVGIKKYGTTLEGNPAGRLERLQHAYEEALDLAGYLRWEIERAKSEEIMGADYDGWTHHSPGAAQPVPDNIRVRILTFDKYEGDGRAKYFDWGIENGQSNIIAYQIP